MMPIACSSERAHYAGRPVGMSAVVMELTTCHCSSPHRPSELIFTCSGSRYSKACRCRTLKASAMPIKPLSCDYLQRGCPGSRALPMPPALPTASGTSVLDHRSTADAPPVAVPAPPKRAIIISSPRLRLCVVQEALTNALRHSGRAPTSMVNSATSPPGWRSRCSTTAPGRNAGSRDRMARAGSGMRERVAMFGGTSDGAARATAAVSGSMPRLPARRRRDR